MFRLSANYTPVEAETLESTTVVPQHIVESVDAGCMEQFLKFLYIGKLEGPVSSRKLKYLAEKYQIKTLISICEAAASKVDGNKLASLTLACKRGGIPLRIAYVDETCIIIIFHWFDKKIHLLAARMKTMKLISKMLLVLPPLPWI